MLELVCPHGCLTNDHFAPREKRRSNCFNDRDNVGKEELAETDAGKRKEMRSERNTDKLVWVCLVYIKQNKDLVMEICLSL